MLFKKGGHNRPNENTQAIKPIGQIKDVVRVNGRNERGGGGCELGR